jgi:hypothetical protein
MGVLLVDRGFEPDVVHKFTANAVYPFRMIPSRGYAAHKYVARKATLVGRPFEQSHIVKLDTGTFVSFNADYWRETSQRAWLADTGAPGGVTLFQPRHPREHIEFAEHVCAEKLTNKYETEHGLRWEWTALPGTHWDWGDALTGCYVAASMSGLSPSGIPFVKRRYVETRKAKFTGEQ